MCRRAAERIAGPVGVLVLSARHGFVRLDDALLPYGQRMDTSGHIGVEYLRAQAAGVGILAARDLIAFGGRAYVDAVTAVRPDTLRPLDGCCGIGEQRSRLARLAAAAEPLPLAKASPPGRGLAARSSHFLVSGPSSTRNSSTVRTQVSARRWCPNRWRVAHSGLLQVIDSSERTAVTTAASEPSTERVPGRVWVIRLTGHSDRTATVTCSTTACRMPPRSADLARLRTFAAQHVSAHARVATVHSNAWCHCGSSQCAAHPDTATHCAGGVALVLQHDPLIGRVWTLQEVCEACASLIPNARVLTRAAQPPRADRPRTGQVPALQVPAPARPVVPRGFSSPTAQPAEGQAMPSRRPRRSLPTSRPVRRRGQAR